MEKKEGVMPEMIVGKRHITPEFEVVEINRGRFFVASGECGCVTGDGGCETGGDCGSYACEECFTTGTRITLSDGTTKPIEAINVGDIIRTFDHETGRISSAKVCLTYKGENKDRALELQFASGKRLSIVGTHDLLAEDTRKYVRINRENAKEFVGKRFYNAELQEWDVLEGYTMSINEVEFYSIYTESHLNCIAEGMLTVPDDVDYILNIYELDENLKADAEQLKADIEKYGLLDVERDYPEFAEFKEQMEALMCKYQYIALGKGLMTIEDFVYACGYWSAAAA